MKLLGPGLWHLLHAYPIKYAHLESTDKQAYVEGMEALFRNVQDAIPCTTCKTHMSNYSYTHSLSSSNVTSHYMFSWTITLHNKVNSRLGLPKCRYVQAFGNAIENLSGSDSEAARQKSLSLYHGFSQLIVFMQMENRLLRSDRRKLRYELSVVYDLICSSIPYSPSRGILLETYSDYLKVEDSFLDEGVQHHSEITLKLINGLSWA